jgi:hypothetical protein
VKISSGWLIRSKTTRLLPHWRHHDFSAVCHFFPARTWRWFRILASRGPEPLKRTALAAYVLRRWSIDSSQHITLTTLHVTQTLFAVGALAFVSDHRDAAFAVSKA